MKHFGFFSIIQSKTELKEEKCCARHKIFPDRQKLLDFQKSCSTEDAQEIKLEDQHLKIEEFGGINDEKDQLTNKLKS